SIVAVSKLLKEVLSLEKDILIDRSHRSLTPKKPNGKPRVIIAKLHYYQDCNKGRSDTKTTPRVWPEWGLLSMMFGICSEANVMFDTG
ncbi:hypothetical protein M9458_056965, partial [Cirrhinus mrigala]